MKDTTLRRMLIDRAYLQNRIKSYIGKNLLYNSISQHEITGHLEKARHNLEFLNEINEHFSDWFIVVSYYAVYHASLALILSKGFFSKNHDATLCVLIKEFYDSEISVEEIDFVNSLKIEEILFYSTLKDRRKDASYSSRLIIDGMNIKKLKSKTISYVNKAEKIVLS